MADLEGIQIVVSPLSGTIYLAKGSAQGPAWVASQKREATAEVVVAFCRHMLHNAPRGAVNTVTLEDGQRYELTVKPAPADAEREAS